MLYYSMYKLANAIPASVPGSNKRLLGGIALGLIPLLSIGAGYSMGKAEDPAKREFGRGIFHGANTGIGALRLSHAIASGKPISYALLRSVVPSALFEVGYHLGENR